MDVIKNADYIIDLGPSAGEEGGYVIALGTPEEVAEVDGSFTGQYLHSVLAGHNGHASKKTSVIPSSV
jgi:excinuclease ABC subunit A